MTSSTAPSPRFSLICGTAGRVAELDRMLRALAAQSLPDFELLLIDQNSDDRVLAILDSLPANLNLRRIVASPGLCRAFNLGLENAHGEIVGFPDDDCWYPQDLLQSVSNLLQSHPAWDGITMPTADERGVPSIVRWSKRPGRVTPSTVGFRGCSTSVFYRRHVCARVGAFDPSVGVIDEPQGSTVSLLSPGSDMDYLHRVIRAGFHIQYQPQLTIHHPQTLPIGTADQRARQKQYRYGYGEGLIARKYSLPLWYPAALVAFPLARALKHAAFRERDAAIREWLIFRGRLAGWLRTSPSH